VYDQRYSRVQQLLRLSLVFWRCSLFPRDSNFRIDEHTTGLLPKIAAQASEDFRAEYEKGIQLTDLQ